MNARNDDGPAFPNNLPGFAHDGMTLRDWFAGMAMQGMLFNQDQRDRPAHRARLAYAMADAMLSERAK